MMKTNKKSLACIGRLSMLKSIRTKWLSSCLMITGILLTIGAQAQVYSYEAESGTLSGMDVASQSCGDCSGGQQVGNIKASNFFTSSVSVPHAGQYTLTLSFASGDSRSIYISVNGASDTEVICYSGDWGVVWTKKIDVTLTAGTNTIKFSNEVGFGPNIDKFTLELNPYPATVYEAEAGTTTGNAAIQSCGNCSGGNQIGNIGNAEGDLTRSVTVSEAGTYQMTLSYSSGTTRTVFVSINDGTAIQVLGNTGQWGVIGTKELIVNLNSGSNSIKFFNSNSGQYAPNIDKFELRRVYGSVASFEAEDGTITGTASVQNCDACSGAKKIGDIAAGKFFTSSVSVPEAGIYTMVLSVESGDPRSIYISVNNGDAKEVKCYSGNWGIISDLEISLTLTAGTNTIKFFNEVGFGPNIDKAVLKERMITWYGSADSNWGTSGNWQDGTVPTSSENVLVPANKTLTIGADFSVKDIVIESGSQIQVASGSSLAIMGTASGNQSSMTVKRNSTGNRGYSILGAAVSGALLSSLSADYLYTYNEVNGTWEVPTGNMTPGKGYFVGYNTSNSTVEVSLTGAPVAGTQTVNITSGGTGGGLNLVANPYSAAISINSFLSNTANSTNTTGTIYLWNDGGGNNGSKRGGDYVAVNNLGSTVNIVDTDNSGGTDPFPGVKSSSRASNGYIGSMQGFFVDGNGSGSTVEFKPEMQVKTAGANSDNNFFRKADEDETQLVKISLSGNGLYSETLVGLTDKATFGKDYGLDAKKFSVNDQIGIYSLIRSEPFTIQGLPRAESAPVEVALGIDLALGGSYIFKINQFESLDDLAVMLIDDLSGKSYLLSESSEISFSSEAGSFTDRFRLVFTPAEVLSATTSAKHLMVFGTADHLTVQYDSNKSELVNIYTLAGYLVFSDRVTFQRGAADFNPNLSVNNIYILSINDRAVKFLLK